MPNLEVHFRGAVYSVTYDMDEINWINVYLVFLHDVELINLMGKNFFHVLQVTNETQNIYWFSSSEAHNREANEFKRLVADAIRVDRDELI